MEPTEQKSQKKNIKIQIPARILKFILFLVILSSIGFGGYRIYMDEKTLATLRSDLYAVRNDYYSGNYFAKDMNYETYTDTTGSYDTTYTDYSYTPTYSQASQTVEEMTVLDQDAAYAKQNATGDYTSASNVYKQADVRVLELKIDNQTASLYTYNSWELQPIDENGVPLNTNYQQVTIKDVQQISNVYIESGKSVNVKLYFIDGGNEIKKLVNSTVGQVYNL